MAEASETKGGQRVSLLNVIPKRTAFRHRPILPGALALMLLGYCLLWYQLVSTETPLTDSWQGDTVSVFAGGAALLLAVAWWRQSQRLLLIGLAVMVGMMLSRSLELATGDGAGSGYGAAASFCWAVVAGATFYVEVSGPVTVKPGAS